MTVLRTTSAGATAAVGAFPQWLTVLAAASLLVGVLCAVGVTVDVVRHPPRMGVMAVVWPLTMLFGGLLWLWFYLRWGREHDDDRPAWVGIATSTSHCGAGCALGDMVGEALVVVAPALLAIAGYDWLFANDMYARWVVDFVLAFAFGIALQYVAITSMRDVSRAQGLRDALKADTLSITAWQVGMFGTMAVAQLAVLPALFGGPAPVASFEFWFVMQIAMVVGFATSFPANVLLVRRGVKESM